MNIEDFILARNLIASHIRETPVTVTSLSGLSLKWDNHQLTGSFKLRGVLNKVLSLLPNTVKTGLVAGSSGNHGIAVAMVAQMIGTAAHIVVPASIPQSKLTHIKKYGAVIESVPGGFYDAAVHAHNYAKENDHTLVISGERDVIAGAGTVALEWLGQSPELKRWLIPMGGGGLLVGMGLVARAMRPEIEIIGVQSVASPYLYHQFYYGHTKNVQEVPTLADGLSGAIEPGSIVLDLLPKVCDSMVLVTDDEIAAAVAYAYHELGEVVECSGAVGLAAILSGKISAEERATGAVVTGGNIDLQQHVRICSNKGW